MCQTPQQTAEVNTSNYHLVSLSIPRRDHGESGGRRGGEDGSDAAAVPGTNCIKIGLPGKLILRKRKGLWEIMFS